MSQDDTNNTNGLEDILNEAASHSPQSAAVPTAPQPQTQVRKGNEVFSGNQPEPALSPQPDTNKQDLGFDIPIDSVPLPSAGLIYPVGHPFHLAKAAEYTAMTAKEEDILMSPALIKRGTVISELIKSSLVNKKVDVSTLLSGDQQALMLGIRMSGYGNVYEPQFNCPSCEAKNTVQIDLSEFEIKSLQIEPIEPGRNLFRFDLPRSKKTIIFKFLTVAEEEKAVKEAEMKKKRGFLKDNLVTTQLLNSIVAVDGDQNRGNIAKFVSNMLARDSMELRKYILKNQPSVETKFEFMCNFCDYAEKVDMPMTLEFFWPGSSDA